MLSGKASGFSVRSDELGGKPAVVVAKGDRIAIGYGLARRPLPASAPAPARRSPGRPDYKAAVAALGKTPISAYVDGPAALQLAEVARSRAPNTELLGSRCPT